MEVTSLINYLTKIIRSNRTSIVEILSASLASAVATGHSLRKIAIAAGVSTKTLSGIRNGNLANSLSVEEPDSRNFFGVTDKINRLAEYFKIDLGSILGDSTQNLQCYDGSLSSLRF